MKKTEKKREKKSKSKEKVKLEISSKSEAKVDKNEHLQSIIDPIEAEKQKKFNLEGISLDMLMMNDLAKDEIN